VLPARGTSDRSARQPCAVRRPSRRVIHHGRVVNYRDNNRDNVDDLLYDDLTLPQPPGSHRHDLTAQTPEARSPPGPWTGGYSLSWTASSICRRVNCRRWARRMRRTRTTSLSMVKITRKTLGFLPKWNSRSSQGAAASSRAFPHRSGWVSSDCKADWNRSSHLAAACGAWRAAQQYASSRSCVASR